MSEQFNINMCEGAILPKIVKYTLPLGLAMLLQIAFHAADMMVVGRYVSANAMAAVGSTGALTALCITLFTGLSVGTSVLTAQYYGAKNWRGLRRVIHTSMAIPLVGGVIMAVFGLLASRTLLEWMETPPEIIEMSKLYLWIIFGGMIFQMTYIFGSAIMRALGDTRRPLFFLTVSGIANILFNLFFVICLNAGVAGVAIATVISNAISSFFIWRTLSKYGHEYRFNYRKLHIYSATLKKMARIGLPAGCQSSCFSLSTLIIQSSINSLGALAMAGNAATLQYEGFLYFFCSYTMHLASVNFVGQNYGGGHYKRIVKSILYCIMLTVILGEVVGISFYAFGRSLISVFNDNPEVIAAGLARMKWMFLFYALCGIMDVLQGACNGLGYSIVPAIMMLFFVCVMRIVWVFTVFDKFRSIGALIVSYPISWVLAIASTGLFLSYILKYRIKPELAKRKKAGTARS